MINRLEINAHEGDLMHMMDATLRMADGELPHLDFMTPIGILGFAPVAGFVSLGYALGKATLLANIAVAAALLPAVWWVGATRLKMGQALFFGAVVLIILTAAIFGGPTPLVSLSMYYNRWGWGIVFVVLATVLFRPRVEIAESWVAPGIVGAGMAALAMLKMTFFAPLAPFVLLVLLLQRRFGLVFRAFMLGAIIGLGLLAWLGLDYFMAYFSDLLAVTGSQSDRVRPSKEFLSVMAGPTSLITTLVLMLGVMVFRKSGQMEEGLVVLLLLPVFSYITYQNWGNDPKWLLLLALYFWVNLPDKAIVVSFALPARDTLVVLLFIALTVIFPSVITMATSPVRAAFVYRADYKPLPMNQITDIWLPERRVSGMPIRVPMESMGPLFPLQDPVEINGFEFPDCNGAETIVPMLLKMAQEAEALENVRGQPVLTADVLSINWLYADLARVKGAAPWYYGDFSGFDNAAFLMVPMCPIKPNLRRSMVSRFDEAGYQLNEVFRSDLMVLYSIVKPTG